MCQLQSVTSTYETLRELSLAQSVGDIKLQFSWSKVHQKYNHKQEKHVHIQEPAVQTLWVFVGATLTEKG